MSTELRVKWLLYVLKKNQDQGFNVIALIVVLCILGLLVAIALPSFLTQPRSRRYPEAKQYVSATNKAQQAYYTENGKFVTESTPEAWASLGVGIKTQTANYKYSISPIGKNGVNAFADATQISKALKNYTGVVGLVQAPNNPKEKTSQAIVCETKNAGEVPMPGIVTATEVKCGSNSNPLR